MIPQSIIDQVLAVPILSVIQDYMTLKKKGLNFVGNCPFHNEKSGSFTVFPAKNNYKCFGCGVHGTAVSFVMEKDNRTFPEACKAIGEKHGIQIIEREITPQEKAHDDLKASLYYVNQMAAAYFQNQLEDPANASVMEYALSRWTKETIEKFQIGYAPDSWHSLIDFAKDQSIKPETLMAARSKSTRLNSSH